MKFLKNYYLFIMYILITVILFGFICPWLISSTHSELVGVGIGLIALVWVPMSIFIVINLFKGGRKNETI